MSEVLQEDFLEEEIEQPKPKRKSIVRWVDRNFKKEKI